MSAGSDIAAEINAALIEAAAATGDGTFYAALEVPGSAGGTTANPTPGTPTYATLTCVQVEYAERDAGGGITGRKVRMLMVSATGTTPVKGQRVAVGYDADDTIPASAWVTINDVVTTAPGGVAVLHELVLAS